MSFPYRYIKKPDNFYLRTEPNPELQTVVATWSTGPVSFGDKIGYTNVTLLQAVYMANGTILKPSRPASAIEVTYTSGQPAGELWSTASTVGNATWHLVLAADLSAPFALHPFHILVSPSASNAQRLMAVPWMASRWAPALVQPFSEEAPLQVPACATVNDRTPFYLYAVSPVLAYTWYFFGEVAKFVPVSPQRFGAVTPLSTTQLQLQIAGSPLENVTVAFMTPAAPQAQHSTCTLRAAASLCRITAATAVCEC